MHLKRVEVENFKSFGHRLTIPFLKGFTSITGPNGSGKSNIGDAILFVLGPKSNKAIRAGKLTDLIFNGGKERKPADHCKVSLVFANEDRIIPVETDEVTLTRVIRLSKSNAENSYSHFFVNGRPSSLGEFDELLAKARISADGYNIVRQGDVTGIVTMSPLARRGILDDIAGITKFDHDIHKANGEKETVQANVERVRIVLDEIDRQLTSLAREREDAVRWRAAKEELDLAKAKLAVRRRQGAEAELATAHAAAAKYEAEREELAASVAKLRADLDGVVAAIAAVEGEIAEKGGADAEQLRAKIDDLKARQVRATERLNYAKGELDDLRGERRALEGDLKRVEKEEAKLGKARDEAAVKRTSAQTTSDDLTEKLETTRDLISKSTGTASDLSRELAELRQSHQKAEDQRATALKEKDRLTEKRERARIAVGEGEELLETAKFALKDAEWEAKELEKEGGGEDPTNLQKELFALKKRESERTRELQELEPAIRRMQNEYSQLKAERDAAESVRTGFTRAVRAVLDARAEGKLKGVAGTISELATVDDKLQTAMEIAAGGRMQAVVVETDAHAAAAIEYLKANRLGRATFLPLNKMTPGRPAGKPLMAVRDEDAEGFAIDLIRFDDKYRNAFWYVFRDTVIMRTMAAARRHMGGVRIVTLDGDLIDAQGAMTGGHDERSAAKPKFGGKTGDDLETLAGKLRLAIDEQGRLAAELGELREQILGTEGRLREATHGGVARRDRLVALQTRAREAKVKVESLEADLTARQAEWKEAEGGLKALDKSLTELEAHLAKLDRTREQKGKLMLAATRKELAEELTRLSAAVDDARATLRDAESQLATRERELTLLSERKAELTRRLSDLAEKEAANAAMAGENETAAGAAEKELTVLLKVQASQNDTLRGLQGKRDAAVEKRHGLEARMAKVQEQAAVKGDLVARERARLPALEAAIEEARAEVAALTVAAPAEFPETLDDLKAAVRKLESALDRLGSVNLLAIEEFDRQSARKNELTEETQRLITQREDLDTLVAEIVARKKEGFFKVYHEINRNFGEVFGRLSDGGKAELILENEGDPFAGGLEMRAQPKGKKLTRLDALSGGEKSLTSMAFIFAIQEFDPSPFYYLDEVDQNLDGINSELLARLVKANSRHAQHIVVSLRKVTLKEADHVYGVTMQENGLSEVVGEVHISEIVDEPERPLVTPGGN